MKTVGSACRCSELRSELSWNLEIPIALVWFPGLWELQWGWGGGGKPSYLLFIKFMTHLQSLPWPLQHVGAPQGWDLEGLNSAQYHDA